jgi:hypothetical protein
MSRIDVVADGKKYKIMINFVQRGITLNSGKLANLEARKLHAEMPQATLNLTKEIING